MIDAGLPCIFVPASSVLGTADPETIANSLRRRPDELDADTALHARLEQIREACGRSFPRLAEVFSISAPKICIVAPPFSYITTGGDRVEAEKIDCVIRAVSVGDFHRTVPATMLSALAVARAMPGSIVTRASLDRPQPKIGGAKEMTEDGTKCIIHVGQPAGISESSVVLNKDGLPTSISYVRTARCLFRGDVFVPSALS